MENQEIDAWLDSCHSSYRNLTQTFVSITENLLSSAEIDYLSVDGRTKDISGIKEKIKRKSYKNPKTQLTDISGVRVILYFESDVEKVCKIIEDAFDVDKGNSLNKEDLLSTNQVGYRSVHLVCELGNVRTSLPEFSNFKNMKCEFQIRTVLQHAWAELAHDRNYKFSGKLPRNIERKLFLYAGMLEIADRGFDELSQQIDNYIEQLKADTESGNLNIEINTLSIDEFVKDWARTSSFPVEEPPDKNYLVLVEELTSFGIKTLEQLKEIIPKNYAEIAKKHTYRTNIYGLIRDWMIMSNYKKYKDDCWHEKWSGIGSEILTSVTREFYQELLGKELAKHIFDNFPFEPIVDLNY